MGLFNKKKKKVEVQDEVQNQTPSNVIYVQDAEPRDDIPYERLDDDEPQLTYAELEGKQKKRRSIAWVLGALAFGGAAYAGYKLYEGSDLAYNHQIESAYVETVETELMTRLQYDLPYDLKDVRINNIIFGDANEDGVLPVDVYYTGAIPEGGVRNVRAIYELAVKYYNNLVEADNSGDIMKYVEALNSCFANMEYVDEENTLYSNDLELDENQAQKFNEFFLGEWGEDQIGFLPYYIERIEAKSIEEGDYTSEHTFRVKGFNFVKNANGMIKLPNINGTILTLNAGKNQVDVYEQEIEITFKFDKKKFIPDVNMAFTQLTQRYLIGKDMAVSFKTISTNKVDLTENFIKMTMDQYNFEK